MHTFSFLLPFNNQQIHLFLQGLSLHFPNDFLHCRSCSDLSWIRVSGIRFCINTVLGNGLFSEDLAQSQGLKWIWNKKQIYSVKGVQDRAELLTVSGQSVDHLLWLLHCKAAVELNKLINSKITNHQRSAELDLKPSSIGTIFTLRLAKICIDESDVLRPHQSCGGGQWWHGIHLHMRIAMISAGQETFSFGEQFSLALSLWVLSSVVSNRGDEYALFCPLLYRKTPNNLAGREPRWRKDTAVQVSHSNQVSLDSGPLGSLLAHLDLSFFLIHFQSWGKDYLLTESWRTSTKPTAITKTWHFAKRIFSLEVSQTT